MSGSQPHDTFSWASVQVARQGSLGRHCHFAPFDPPFLSTSSVATVALMTPSAFLSTSSDS